MRMYNAKNERLKRAYFEYALQADKKCPATVNGIRRAVTEYEKHIGYQDFGMFKKEMAISFKEQLLTRKSKNTGQPVRFATSRTKLDGVKKFHLWLSVQPGHKSKICKSDIQFFNLAEKENRTARQEKYRAVPTLEQAKKALLALPARTEIECRDRAIMACILVSGIRVGAATSLRLKHVDFDNRMVRQDPTEVNTKFGKRIDSYFFPVGDEPEQILREWVKFLREVKGYEDDDPLFPRTKTTTNDRDEFESDGLEKELWATSRPINMVFKKAFKNAGLPYFIPHSFRDTLVNLGQ